MEQEANQDYFKFTVESCYATSGPLANPTNQAEHKDVFIENKCPIDETTTGTYRGDGLQYQIKTMAFTFFQPKTGEDAIHFHCLLKGALFA